MTTRQPITDTFHLIQGDDGVIYETGPKPLSFADAVHGIRAGEWGDVHRVIAVNLAQGKSEDVTEAVAYELYDDSQEHPLSYRSEAFTLVENELSCNHAERAAWEDAAERARDRHTDQMIDERRDRRLGVD